MREITYEVKGIYNLIMPFPNESAFITLKFERKIHALSQNARYRRTQDDKGSQVLTI